MNAPIVLTSAAFTEAYFHELAGVLDRLLGPAEFYMCSLSAETSDFVRFNRGKVRQPGTVSQCYLDVTLVQGSRHASERLSLSGHPALDREAVASAMRGLRTILPSLAEDPHLLHATEVHSTRHVAGGPFPPAEAVVERVLDVAAGHDLVGIYAGGSVARGFANALGQRNWHETSSFDLEWSLYHRDDKAVKASYAGLAWNPQELAQRMERSVEELALVARAPHTLAPGAYRAFLTPAAMEEIFSIVQWSGFSARALATKQSSLQRLRDEGATLSPAVTIRESTGNGLAPAFQGEGFARPEDVPLIDAGRLVGALVSPRTAREFALATNGANGAEVPESLAMAPGTLAGADVLAALDTGLYIGNLWYLNYSDRPACRMTGMTRFGTFWVEGGRIQAPVNVLRFDDTLYRMLGANLEALTSEAELRLDPNTYGERSLTSMRVPGALLTALEFTL